jgi:hypothetical protein
LVLLSVNLSLCLFNHHTLKMYGVVNLELHAYLTSVLYTEKRQLPPRSLYPEERATAVHWIGGLVDLKTRSGSWVVQQENLLLLPAMESLFLGRKACSPVTISTELPNSKSEGANRVKSFIPCFVKICRFVQKQNLLMRTDM